MPEELKKCPYCAGEDDEGTFTIGGDIACDNPDCPAYPYMRLMPREAWQSRPLEDALQARIDELEATVSDFMGDE